MKRLWMFFILILLLGWNSLVFAQNATPQLIVTGVNTSNLPNVDLTLAVSDESGQLLDLNNSELVDIKHNGERVEQAAVIGSEPAGTFTIILLDLSSGAAEQTGTIQESIQSFASPSFMREQVDHIAIYQVDGVNSNQQLQTTFFYNDVTNLFATGLAPFDGATALFDSVGDLLNRIDELKPSPELATSIVLMSDGTDAVSSQFVADEIAPLASSKGVAIHTVIIDTGLSDFSRDIGSEYMQKLAADTGGVAANFTDATSLNNIWTRIISRGFNTIVRYIIGNLQPGVFDVEVSFPNRAQLPIARTQISVPASIPSVSIETPEQAYALSLPLNAETGGPDPLDVQLPVSVIWLDGTERSVAQAQLWHDGSAIFEIAPEELAEVAGSLPLHYGDNRVQIVIVDETGQQASSNELLLTVTDGDLDVPSDIGRSGFGIPRNILAFIGICVLILLLLFALRLLWPRIQAAQANASPSSAPSRERRATETDAPSTRTAPARDDSRFAPPPPPVRPKTSAPTPPPYAPTEATQFDSDQRTIATPTRPSIEVLDSQTQTERIHPLIRSEYLIGRSATVDLPLKDDPTVSRIHATIVEDGSVYRIYDEQSTSGTYVNDSEVPEYGLQLTDGDEIHMGAVHLRFRQP